MCIRDRPLRSVLECSVWHWAGSWDEPDDVVSVITAGTETSQLEEPLPTRQHADDVGQQKASKRSEHR